MRTALALAVLLGVIFGVVEMGVLPEQSHLDHLDTLQRTRRSPPQGPCTPGDTWPDACNACWCPESGEAFACTKRACLTIPNEPAVEPQRTRRSPPPGPCTPGDTWPDACNKCWCPASGEAFACTKRACLPHLDESALEPQPSTHTQNMFDEPRVCEPYIKFQKECNICSCNSEGTSYSCTRLACDGHNNITANEVLAHRKEENKEELSGSKNNTLEPKICKPNSKIKIDCNTCRCNLEGTAYICTRIGCDGFNSAQYTYNANETRALPNPTDKTEEELLQVEELPRETCVPGEKVFKDCNTCICNKAGTTLACTRMQCIEENWQMDEESEKPRLPESWRRM